MILYSEWSRKACFPVFLSYKQESSCFRLLNFSNFGSSHQPMTEVPIMEEIICSLPQYECVPKVPSTPVPCPPVECPNNLTVMFFQAEDRSACPRYTCLEVTPTPGVITPSTVPPKCPHVRMTHSLSCFN